MKQLLTVFALNMGLAAAAWAQDVTFNEARFRVGDDPAWAAPAFPDGAWQTLTLDKDGTAQGVANANAFAWYRIHVTIPSSLKKRSPEWILLDLGPIDDSDETFLNGRPVGKTGTFPTDPEGFFGAWEAPRHYAVPSKYVRWDKDNVIAVRVYNGGDPGGFYAGGACIGQPALPDLVTLSVTGKDGDYQVELVSRVKTFGTLSIESEDVATGVADPRSEKELALSSKKPTLVRVPVSGQKRLTVKYADRVYGGVLEAGLCEPYILTPPAPAIPRYNGPLVYGLRPGSPLIFRLAFSGEKPMKYAVEGLPEGLHLDADEGVLSGSLDKAGDYPMTFVATNGKGTACAAFTLKVGKTIALTPPMGWNSWNCWGTSVSQEKVMASAAAFLNRGLADYGYSYINIDDAWEAEERAADGSIVTNEKFPDMKGLSDWLHSHGLKLGIYSSPGDRTCGGYLGTLDHERQDAETWNAWGIDYLKYDWCGYDKVSRPEPTVPWRPMCART